MRLRLLICLSVLVPSLAFACPPPSQWRKELPLTPCPTGTAETRAELRAFYSGAPVKTAGTLIKALEADKWSTRVAIASSPDAPKPGDPVLTINATRGTQKLTARVEVAESAKHTAIVFELN